MFLLHTSFSGLINLFFHVYDVYARPISLIYSLSVLLHVSV